MIIRSLDGLDTFLRAPDGVDSGVPTTGGELSLDQGLALFGAIGDDADTETADADPPGRDPSGRFTKQEDATADDGDGAEIESEPDEGEDVGSQDETPDETEEQDDPADDTPPIDPPRSWTKEERDVWAQLPRATQERLAERERGREADFLRRQQAVDKEAKEYTSRTQAAEQARQQYEETIQRYAEVVTKDAQAGTAKIQEAFPEIKSWDDVKKLAATDPIRYSEWDAASKEVQASINAANAAQAEQLRLSTQRQQESLDAFKSYVSEEQKKFLEVAPEFADPKQAPRLQAEVRQMLVEDYRLSPDELKALWADGQPLSVHDHRFQMLIRDAHKFRAAKAAASKKSASLKKPSTPVQQPGNASTKREAVGGRTKQLNDNLTRTGSRDAGLALITQILGAKKK